MRLCSCFYEGKKHTVPKSDVIHDIDPLNASVSTLKASTCTLLRAIIFGRKRKVVTNDTVLTVVTFSSVTYLVSVESIL